MINKPIRPFRRGDHPKAADLEEMRNRLQRQRINVGQSCGIVIQESETGTALRVPKTANGWYGVANGNIPARSGTTLGMGKMTIHHATVTTTPTPTATDNSASIDLDVLNPSSNTMGAGEGITSGKYCFAQPDAYGNVIISPLEC